MVEETPGAGGSGNRRKRRALAAGSRRGYDLDFKLKVLNETFAPDASVAAVARRHGMNTNVLFRWRKQFREGRLGGKTLPAAGFVPVHVDDDAGDVRLLPAPREPGGENVKVAGPAEPAPAQAQAGSKIPGLIEIETAGGVKLRLSGRVDDRALRRVLAAIRRLA
jgi:transposase